MRSCTLAAPSVPADFHDIFHTSFLLMISECSCKHIRLPAQRVFRAAARIQRCSGKRCGRKMSNFAAYLFYCIMTFREAPAFLHQRIQNRLEVRNDVLRILQTNADADQTLRDSGGLELFGGISRVGHGGGMLDQGLRITQGDGNDAQLQLVERSGDSGAVGLELHGDHARRAASSAWPQSRDQGSSPVRGSRPCPPRGG